MATPKDNKAPQPAAAQNQPAAPVAVAAASAPHERKKMLVRAKARGYCGRRIREAGSEFLWPCTGDFVKLDPAKPLEQQLPSWLEPASAPKREQPKVEFQQPMTMSEHRRRKDTSLADLLAPKQPQDDPAAS